MAQNNERTKPRLFIPPDEYAAKKRKMVKLNKDSRDRRRIQFTLLTFVYAYERRLSLEIIKPYIKKEFKLTNCTANFYKLYNMVTEDGAMYDVRKLSDCGKSLLVGVFGTLQHSSHGTLENVSCINYFLIKSLGIDVSKYNQKIDLRKTTPFIDIDMRSVLKDMWSIDIEKFYNSVDFCITKTLIDNRNPLAQKRVYISNEKIVEAVQAAVINNLSGYTKSAPMESWKDCKELFDIKVHATTKVTVGDKMMKRDIENEKREKKQEQEERMKISDIVEKMRRTRYPTQGFIEVSKNNMMDGFCININ